MIGDEVDPSVISIPEWIKLPRYFFMDPQIELSPNPNFSSRWIRESSCPARPCNTVSDTGSSAIPRPGQQSNLTSTSYYLDILGPITSVFSRNIYICIYIILHILVFFGIGSWMMVHIPLRSLLCSLTTLQGVPCGSSTLWWTFRRG